MKFNRSRCSRLIINNNAANLQVRTVFNVLEFTFWFSTTLCLLKYQLLARKQLFLKDDKLFTITHIYNSLETETCSRVRYLRVIRTVNWLVISCPTVQKVAGMLYLIILHYIFFNDVDLTFITPRWDVFVKVHMCAHAQHRFHCVA